jgi:hypothetical protein
MGASALGSKSDLDLLRHAIDYLSCKAQQPLHPRREKYTYGPASNFDPLRVDDRYVFEPFERASFVTNIPLGSSALHLPDGLSRYMCILKIADEFDYSAEWPETWSV